MKIKSLKYTHPLIYKRILECQENQGNTPDDSLGLGVNLEDGNFIWASTVEGVLIWSDVDDGKFESWYRYHNLPLPDEISIASNKKHKFAFQLNIIASFLKIMSAITAAIIFMPMIDISLSVSIWILISYTIGEILTIIQSKLQINNKN